MQTGDELFKRLLKYDFDECREGEDLVKYLESHFKMYICDIKEVIELENPLLGHSFCQEVSNNISIIEESYKLILEVIKSFNQGSTKKVYEISYELFDLMNIKIS